MNSALKKFTDRFDCIAFMETNYVNTDMCRPESTQRHEAESSRAIPRKLAANLWAFNCCWPDKSFRIDLGAETEKDCLQL